MSYRPEHGIHRRAWIRSLFARLRRGRGGRCRACSATEGLEWAHRRPTGLAGMGRGSYERFMDIRDHPRRYVLLCRSCHLAFDAGWLRPASGRLGWRADLIRRGISRGSYDGFKYYSPPILRRGRQDGRDGAGGIPAEVSPNADESGQDVSGPSGSVGSATKAEPSLSGAMGRMPRPMGSEVRVVKSDGPKPLPQIERSKP